jgi:hypothetical protein
MGNTVTAPLVIVKRQDGSDLYLYAGSVLPDHVPAVEVKRLVDGGLVAGDTVKVSAGRKPAAESN